MSNWVTLPNGVHIDLDDPNNPLTGDGSFDSYLGGGKSENTNKIEKGNIYKNKNGAEIKIISADDKYVTFGFTDKNSALANKVRDMKTVEKRWFSKYVKGKWYSKENISSKVDFKAEPTMSGKDSKSFDRDLERAFKEFDGDEDAILDALRSTGKDYGMSNSDLQGVVESYVLTHSGESSVDLNEPSPFAMAKEMGMKASDLIGLSSKDIRERYKTFKKSKK